MKTKIDIERNRDTFKISVKKGDGKPTKVETSDKLFAKTTVLSIMDSVRREFFAEEVRVEEFKDKVHEERLDKEMPVDKPKKGKGKDK